MRRWQTSSLFALSELVCTKNVFYPILLFPTFSPQASSPLSHHRRTDNILHPLLPKFFFFSTERAGPYPQAQLYWAGRTMGWMADWTSSWFLRKNTVSERRILGESKTHLPDKEIPWRCHRMTIVPTSDVTVRSSSTRLCTLLGHRS